MEIEPTLYRLAARAMFAPFGGLDFLRQRSLDALQITSGDKVLELGCGPGDITAQLLARGASVHAIDNSPEMLKVAGRQAPGAELERADLRSYVPAATYDGVILAFVLHELAIDDVARVVVRAAAALNSGSRIVILDHAAPVGSGGASWRAILRGIESRKIDAWLDLDVARIVRNAGIEEPFREDLANGRAQLIFGTKR